MVEVAFAAGRLFVAFFLVFLNGFFVAAEFAYVRIRPPSVERLVEEGKHGAQLLEDVMANLDDYLAVTQLGITISSLGLGWVGEPAVAALIEPVLEPVLPANVIHLVAFGLGFGVITFLHVVFGELAPKTIAIAQAERISLFVAPPMKVFYYLFIPGIVVFNGTANAFTRLIGIPPASESEETLTEEELLTVLARSGREGHIGTEEVEMVERVFELDDISVREVMVPRPDVVSGESDVPLSSLRALVTDAGYTRYPVVDAADPEQVVGFVDVKDVLQAEEFGDDVTETITAGDLAREMVVVPETERVTDLLTRFQTEQRQMAAIIDEWGAFEGIATVEDVVEVVVGDIHDEFDQDEQTPAIERRDEGTLRADGSVTVSAVNDELDAHFETDQFDTVAGLVLSRLGRAPHSGDQIQADGYLITVEETDGTRITSVPITEQTGRDGEQDDT